MMVSSLSLLLDKNFSSLKKDQQDEVYSEFYYFVNGLVKNLTKDCMLAEDMVQEVFIKTLYSCPSINNEKQLKAWIRTTTKNQTLNVLRKNNKLFLQNCFDNIKMYENNVEKKVEQKAQLENIGVILKEYNANIKQLLWLKWELDKSIKEIAIQLNLTEGAIKQKIFRVRKTLKMKLEHRWEETN